MSSKEKFNINTESQPNSGIAITVVGERGRKRTASRHEGR